MHLVNQVKGKPGSWEVAWMWLPQFLAMDPVLIRTVAEDLTKEFEGSMAEGPELLELQKIMSQRAVELIAEKRPVKGLRQYLDGLQHVSLEEMA